MNTATNRYRQYSHKFNGITRTVICVDHSGPDAVVLSSEFDLHNKLLRQVRFEHLNGVLANSVFTEFMADGHIAEQWVFLYDREGQIAETYGFDEEGRPLEMQVEQPLAC
jgi:hypothetical protein